MKMNRNLKIFQMYYKLIDNHCNSSYNDTINIRDVVRMKHWALPLGLLILLVCVGFPSVNYAEDKDTVLLARAIYAICGEESYETKLALGSVVMNRVDDPWFPSTTSGVLNAQHQFPIGKKYDSESLKAAHAVLSGRRTLPADALYYRTARVEGAEPIAAVGSLTFYNNDTGR